MIFRRVVGLLCFGLFFFAGLASAAEELDFFGPSIGVWEGKSEAKGFTGKCRVVTEYGLGKKAVIENIFVDFTLVRDERTNLFLWIPEEKKVKVFGVVLPKGKAENGTVKVVGDGKFVVELVSPKEGTFQIFDEVKETDSGLERTMIVLDKDKKQIIKHTLRKKEKQ